MLNTRLTHEKYLLTWSRMSDTEVTIEATRDGTHKNNNSDTMTNTRMACEDKESDIGVHMYNDRLDKEII